MKLLLDTHIWIWSLLQTDRLSNRVARELRNVNNELWLSSISLWEFVVLCQKGRLRVKGDPVEWAHEGLRALPCHEAAITHEVALAVHGLKLPQRHPADRLLVATAKVFDLTLVTADALLRKTPDCEVLLNS